MQKNFRSSILRSFHNNAALLAYRCRADGSSFSSCLCCGAACPLLELPPVSPCSVPRLSQIPERAAWKAILGVSPGTLCTGFPSPCTGGAGTVSGTTHVADLAADQAQTDATDAYLLAAAQTCTSTFSLITDIGGMTLTPGVYCFPSSAGVTGTLTLDAEGDANAVFIFEIGSTLTTASASNVVLINSAQSGNVFWQVGGSATLGAAANLAGNLVALNLITATTGATSSCGLYALSDTVALDSNSIQICHSTPGEITLVNDASITIVGTPFKLNGSSIEADFTFTTSISDHRGSGAGWRLQASVSDIRNGPTHLTTKLTAQDATSTCTNGPCPATTFTPITLSTTPTTFLTAGNATGTVIVDGDYTNVVDGQIIIPANAFAGLYTGSISITFADTF